MPPSFPPDIQPTVLRDPRDPAGLRLRGYHPLRRRVPADFGFTREGLIRGPCNPTSPGPRRPGVQFALCRFRSPLLTASLLLSFPAGTKMFQFPAFPLRGVNPGVRHKPREVPFGNPRFDGCLRLAGAYRSLPRPSSAPRAEPSTGRLSVLAPLPEGPDTSSAWPLLRGVGPRAIGGGRLSGSVDPSRLHPRPINRVFYPSPRPWQRAGRPGPRARERPPIFGGRFGLRCFQALSAAA